MAQTPHPNLMLARELLKKGRRDMVLEYFPLCGKFEPYDPLGRLAHWTEQANAGKISQSGPNFIY